MGQKLKDLLKSPASREADFSKPLVFYGAGQAFCNTYNEYKLPNIRVCDSDPHKIGTTVCGHTVQSFEDLVKEDDIFQLVISSRVHYGEIKEYVCRYIDEKKVVHIPSKFLNHFYLWANHVNDFEVLYDALYDDISRGTLVKIVEAHKYYDASCFPQNVTIDDVYFEKDIVHLSENEVFVDGGAYDGDTLARFIEKTGNQFKRAYCFEPNDQLLQKLTRTLPPKESRVIVVNKGLWDSEETLRFDLNDGGNSKINPLGEISIITTTIDKAVDDEVSFIKMDIEGSELAALYGAKQTIVKHKPKLAICLYHKPEDIVEIPKFIMSLGLDYKYFLRQYVPSFTMPNMVFYAV